MDAVVTNEPQWPQLREELALYPGPRALDGTPTWTLHDPSTNRYYRLGWLEFECLQYWSLADAEQIALAIEQTVPIHATADSVSTFVQFLERHHLLKPIGAKNSQQLVQFKKATETGFWTWLLHNYLFLRIPLIRPNRFLQGVIKQLNWLFCFNTIRILIIAGCLALYLITRQWNQYSHSFLYVLTAEGIVTSAFMLCFAKMIHELGHALTASHFGCRVPTMGVAFMLGFPVLWTDVTDAWRLSDRHQRLLIDGAGMLAELSLAILATFLWLVLPDGELRSGVYVLSSTTWILTLAINLNPFMRFDGYYLLADFLDVANLQDRSFALAKWHLREWLFRLKALPPETWTPAHQHLLLIYAYGTWIYRLLLFTGIAWAVYHFFFKVLGLVLFAVEIGWFILRPMIKEIGAWQKLLATQTESRRFYPAWLLPIGLLILLFIPWQTRLLAPGLLQSAAEYTLYSTQPAQVKRILTQEGNKVDQGQVLLELTSPDLDFKIADTERRRRELTAQLDAQSLDLKLAQHNPVDFKALQSTLAELEGLKAISEQLTLRSTFNGYVRDLSDHLQVGAWLAKDEPLGIVTTAERIVIAYSDEASLSRLQLTAKGWFYPDGGDISTVPVELISIDQIGSHQLTLNELSSRYGGEIAVREDEQHRLIPEQGVYRLVLQVKNLPSTLPMTLRGRVSLETPSESLAGRVFHSLLAILIRESGW